MEELRAFVGHSFSSGDKALVAGFLGYFESLSRLYPTFTWDHAEEAEPLPLSKKVMAKIEGKNVFIGICTKNERAVRDSDLRPALLRKSVLVTGTRDVEWKASDWIIQEIGLAVGRGMSIILFREEGVRAPGGLYGDIEYIPFSRANPHESFEKFVQMLVALKPKSAVTSSAATKAPPDDEKNELEEPSGESWEPKPDWKKDQYDHALLRMALDRNSTGLESIDSAFRSSALYEGMAGAEWEGQVEWLRSLFIGNSDFEKLRRLADENPKSSLLRMYVARRYVDLKEHENAARAFENAASIAENDEYKVLYEAEAAIEYARAGRIALARTVFERLKRMAKDSEGLLNRLAIELRSFAQIEKDDEFELAILERMVELKPGDVSLRFQLAYKHSEYENNDMALHHYTTIPILARDAITWNNLGVTFGNFQMPVRSTSAFKRAEEQGDTLAMSNIGFSLLRVGFLDEAGERANKALQSGNYHENITDLLKRVKLIPDEEDKKETEALDKVKPKAAFYRQLGKAALSEAPVEIGNTWQAPECVLETSLDGATVRLSGSYEQDVNPFSIGLLGGASRKEKRRIVYTLQLHGNMLTGQVKRSTEGEQPTLASLGMDAIRVAMYFDAERRKIYVMEGYSSGAGRFYELEHLS